MFTTESHPYMTAAELRSRCTAAARLSLRGTGYTPEDRAECAADIMARVLEKIGTTTPDIDRRAPLGYRPLRESKRDAVVRMLDWMRRAERGEMDWHRTTADLHVRRESVRFSYLTGLAANYRRALDAERKRDDDHAAERAATDGFVPRVMTEGPAEYVTTPDAARRAAMDACDALGLRPLRAADVNVYRLAYTSARLSGAAALGADMPLDRIASELDMEGATAAKTLGMSLKRAPKRIPSATVYPMNAHLDAAHLLDIGGVARKATASRNATAALPTAERYSDGITHAVTVTTDRTVKRDGRRKYAPADWTTDLPPATAARLARAAELSRARRKATDYGTRESIDTERGAARPELPSAE